MGCERIGVKKLDYYVNDPNAVIIDLRDNVSFKQSHVKGAINIPYDDFDRIFNASGRFVNIAGQKYSFNNIFVFYCDRGATSLMVCSEMAEYGVNAKSVVGGFVHYNGKFLVVNGN